MQEYPMQSCDWKRPGSWRIMCREISEQVGLQAVLRHDLCIYGRSGLHDAVSGAVQRRFVVMDEWRAPRMRSDQRSLRVGRRVD